MEHVQNTQTVISFAREAALSGNIYKTYDALDLLITTAREINKFCNDISVDLEAPDNEKPIESCHHYLNDIALMANRMPTTSDNVSTLQNMIYISHKLQDSCVF